MANELSKKQNFASREVAAAERLIDALNDWNDLQVEWFAQNYSTEIEDEDLQGENEHLTATDLTNGFVTFAAVKSLMESGHWANLYNLKK